MLCLTNRYNKNAYMHSAPSVNHNEGGNHRQSFSAENFEFFELESKYYHFNEP